MERRRCLGRSRLARASARWWPTACRSAKVESRGATPMSATVRTSRGFAELRALRDLLVGSGLDARIALVATTENPDFRVTLRDGGVVRALRAPCGPASRAP